MSNKLKERGAAALEFVFIAPVFFLVLFGSLLLGFAFYLHSQVQAAAWNGVQAVLQVDRSSYDLPADAGDFKAFVEPRAKAAAVAALASGSSALATGVTSDDVKVTVDDDQITVTVTYDYKEKSSLPTMGFLDKISGSATASFW